MTPTTMETVSGIFVDLANPKASDLNINDIAWSLSRQSRYAGHTMCRIPYTVAQHTVMVSRYVEEALTPDTCLNAAFLNFIQAKLSLAKNIADVKEFGRILAENDFATWQAYSFHGLMHDFAEAYLVDLPTPVKRLPGVYEPYKAVELKMDALIYETFGLSYSENSMVYRWKFGQMVVGWADMYALQLESYHFMPSRGLNWGIPLERPSLQQIYGFRWPVTNEQAYEELLARFDELQPKDAK